MSGMKYPKKKGFLTWEELGYVARALGFPADTYSKCIPESYVEQNADISMQALQLMIDHHKYFNAALDRTFNLHSDEWNLAVLHKALAMLSARMLSIEELYLVRVAYQVYEEGDTKGMLLDQYILLRALKLCGYVISPLKMQQRLKHMQTNFEEPDRVQLHEFLDLIYWCVPYVELAPAKPDLEVAKDEKQLYKIEDFYKLLSHHDEQQFNRLNKEYVNQERKFIREKHDVTRFPKDVPPVNTEIRKQLVHYHGERYKFLNREVEESLDRLHQAKAGYVRPRPLTAPDLTMHESVDPGMTVSSLEGRSQTVLQMANHLIQQPVSRMVENDCPRPSIKVYMRPKTAEAVSGQEILNTKESLEALKFEMETVEMKYQHMIREDLEFIRPGFHERKHARTSSDPEMVDVSSQTQVIPMATETFKKNPQQKSGPSLRRSATQYHRKTCDARYRGWNNAQTKPGPHLVLVAPSFDNSPKGHLFAKMHNHHQAEAGREKEGKFIYRFTPRSQLPMKQKQKAIKLVPDREQDSVKHMHASTEEIVENSNINHAVSQEASKNRLSTSLSGDLSPSDKSWSSAGYKNDGTNWDQESILSAIIKEKSSTGTPVSKQIEANHVSTSGDNNLSCERMGKVNIMKQIVEMEPEILLSHALETQVQSQGKGRKGSRNLTCLTVPGQGDQDCLSDVAKMWGKEHRRRKSYTRLIDRAEDCISKQLKKRLLSGLA